MMVDRTKSWEVLKRAPQAFAADGLVVTHHEAVSVDGGEFGTRWHDAGRRAGKRLSHDDFAAVAADLVKREVTQPRRIAAEGGSNGGILITNMLVRYPERFGALFCTIPLIDMRRYHLEQATFTALGYTFLREKIGWVVD
jgi:prolyl oligopeptidase PreP (S9A serine peptidase family)